MEGKSPKSILTPLIKALFSQNNANVGNASGRKKDTMEEYPPLELGEGGIQTKIVEQVVRGRGWSGLSG